MPWEYLVIPVARAQDGKVSIGDVSIPDDVMQVAPDVLLAVAKQLLQQPAPRPAPAARPAPGRRRGGK
jgi:hypothetical protein